MSNWFASPFIVPVAGCFMILGLGIGGIYSEIRTRELRSQERLAMLSRGMSPAEVEDAMSLAIPDGKLTPDPLRSLANTRRSATVLISTGVALSVFGLLLWLILQVRPVLVVAAAGAINAIIGIGFLADYQMQKRELERFHAGLLEDAGSSLRRP